MSGEGEIAKPSSSEDLVVGDHDDKLLKQTVTDIVEHLFTVKLADFKKEINDGIESTISKKISQICTQDASEKQESVLHEREDSVHPEQIAGGNTILEQDGESYWRKKAKEEWKSARNTDLKTSRGIHTVICLDTSGSIKEKGAWKQSRQFCADYLEGLKSTYSDQDKHEKIALVTFGNTTKVQWRFTTDYDGLKKEIDKLRPKGPSPMFGGLVLSKAVAETSDYRFPLLNETVQVMPKVILITDGKPTSVNIIDGEDEQRTDVQKTQDLIITEVKSMREARIELHIVYVGAADYDYLHKLREAIDAEMMPYTDGDKMANYVVIKCLLPRVKQHKIEDKSKEQIEMEKALATLHKKCTESISSLAAAIPDWETYAKEAEERLKNLLTSSRDRYLVVDDKRYPAIGQRVRRGKNWSFGDQDDNGAGTIIGHLPKDDKDERQIWVWIEWDENEVINVYRYKTLKGTKADVKLVTEERLPPDDFPLAVGMKVGIGKDFEGEKKPRQGVVIKLSDPSDDDGSVKAEVLWEDGSRGEYFFGVGEGETKIEIEPRSVFDKPDKPQHLMVSSVTSTEVCLKWDRPASCGGCNIMKYTVYRKCDDGESDWLETMDVDGSQTTSAIPDLLPRVKYMFAVRAENKEGPGPVAMTEVAVLLESAVCKPLPPEGPLQIIETTNSTCTLTWKHSPKCESAPVTHYLLEYRESSCKRWESINVGLQAEYRLTKLKKSTCYDVRIKSVNKTGQSDPNETDAFVTRNVIDADTPDAELNDKDIAQLAPSIGDNWELLGPHFGFSNNQVSQIKSDHKDSQPLQVYTMLTMWKSRNSKDATLHKFLECVETQEAVNINWGMIEKVKKAIKNEV